MREAMRITKMPAGHAVATSETGRETVEVAEAIKALQMQLADLRKIVQAAKISHDTRPDPVPRQ
jgi:protein subunit release factor A